jgi:hypothetical protein
MHEHGTDREMRGHIDIYSYKLFSKSIYMYSFIIIIIIII